MDTTKPWKPLPIRKAISTGAPVTEFTNRTSPPWPRRSRSQDPPASVSTRTGSTSAAAPRTGSATRARRRRPVTRLPYFTSPFSLKYRTAPGWKGTPEVGMNLAVASGVVSFAVFTAVRRASRFSKTVFVIR